MHFLGMSVQNQKLPTQFIISRIFWAKIFRIAHLVNYSYLPPWTKPDQNQGRERFSNLDNSGSGREMLFWVGNAISGRGIFYRVPNISFQGFWA